MSPVADPLGLVGSGSFMISTNSTVPIGTFVHERAGEILCPAPAYFTGISPPSDHDVLVKVNPGPPPPLPPLWAPPPAPPPGAPPPPGPPPRGAWPPPAGACAA